MKTREEIFELIEEENVEFIRLQFTDILGNLRNIAVTPSQMGRVLDNQYSFAGAGLVDGNAGIDEELYLKPDLDSFVILPWRPQQGKVAKFTCDVCAGNGKVLECSPRAILKRVLDDAKKKGYTAVVDPECEFFLFHVDDDGMPTTITHEQAGYMDVGPIDFGENARRDMVLNLEEMGFEIESSHHEKAPGQHEIDFKETEGLEIADSIMTFRFAVRSIAKRFGLYATFMPKPKADAAGSGMHLNISLYKNGKNVFQPKKADETVTKEAKYFTGGILKHAKAMCAITNPIVNSYKRIMSGFDAPNIINCATKGESSLVKIHKSFGETKVELRFPDSAANPYLAIAVAIAAGIDGIENKMECAFDDDSSLGNLPENLKDALDIMTKDSFIKSVLGKDFVKVYSKIKYEEWRNYMLQVSDWEVNKYLVRM